MFSFYKSAIITIIFFYGFQSGIYAQQADTIHASEFGVKPNTFSDMARGIQQAINACKSKNNAILVLPAGRIDIWPQLTEKREMYISNCTEDDTLSKVKSIAFLFENCRNITLDGNNSLVVLHGKMVSFAIINSINIQIKKIRFDYERPTMSEMTIRSVTVNAVEADIHPDSKYYIANGHINFYGEGWKTNSLHTISLEPGKDIMRYSTFQPLLDSRVIQTSPYQLRFEGDFSKTNYHVGDVLTFRDPYRDNCGAFINRSKDILLDNVKMHYMHGLGIVSQFSENIALKKVVVAPRENSGRVIAAFADCFHFSGCKGLIKIDSCLTSGSHDDPINVHGTHLQVTGIDASKKMTVRFMHHQTWGFEAFFAGDSIAFINPQTLMPLGTARLKTANLINRKEMELEVEGELPANITSGLCIENLTWTPELIIQNSRFERTNTRGLLVTTRRKVLIENNTFFHTGMFPILIADDATSWFESGPVQDVTIRNNVFEDCGYNSGSGAINIAPENHELVIGNMVHRNISITGNTFKVYNDAVLSARSVDHLVFTGNKIIHTHFMEQAGKQAAIDLMACKNVIVEKNMFDSNDEPVINTDKMTKKDIRSDLKVNMKL